MHRLLAPPLVLALALLLPLPLVLIRQAAAASTPVAGEPLGAALRALGSGELRIIYSTALVPESLRVLRTPTADTPLAQVREILAPHGLALSPAGGGLLVVTRSVPPASTPRQEPRGAAGERAVVLAAAPGVDGGNGADPVLAERIVEGQRSPFGRLQPDGSLQFSAVPLAAEPALGEDVFQRLSRLPGIGTSDVGAALNIRGGGPSQTLVLLDGFPIRQPYHMPGYRGLLSIIDPNALSTITVYTGNLPARYGGRMSGVVDLTGREAADGPARSVGASYVGLRARGLVGDEDADALVAGRIGSTGYLLKALEPASATPRYRDAYARLRLRRDDGADLALHALLSGDSLSISRDGLQEVSGMTNHANYVWLAGTLPLGLGDGGGARLRGWLGRSTIELVRDGSLDSPGFATGALSEQRRTELWDAAARLDFRVGNAHAIEAGVELSQGEARYDYDSRVGFDPSVRGSLPFARDREQQVSLAPRRRQWNAYLADDIALHPRVLASAGLRASVTDVPGQVASLEWDPRLSLAWRLTPRLQLRTGAGRASQLGDLSEIVPGSSPDGSPVVQESRYVNLGFDRSLGRTLQLRVEAFQKEQQRLPALQRNLLRTPSILPELRFDRVFQDARRARIHGLELNLQQVTDDWRWSLGYTLQRAQELDTRGWARRSSDQRHNASLAGEWTRGAWLFGGVANFRSGLPTTALSTYADGRLALGNYNAASTSATLSADLRAVWRKPTPAGLFSATAQVSNLLNTRGGCCAELALTRPDPLTAPRLALLPAPASPVVPWIGLSLDF